VELLLEHEALVRLDKAGEHFSEVILLLAQTAEGKVGEHTRIVDTGEDCFQHPPEADLPTTFEATEASLILAPSRTFWMRLTSAVRSDLSEVS
jgi:hypothetical protein